MNVEELSSLEDGDLVALYMKGATQSESALEELLKRYYPMVLKMSYMRVLDHSLSLDCAQEALLAVSKAIPGFKGESKFSTWVYSIARRVIWKQFGKRKRFLSIIQAAQEHSTIIDTIESASVENAVIEKEQQHEILRAIGALPPKQRDAILLYYYQDYSLEDIAELIGCKASTVKAHLFKARAKLEKQLLSQKERVVSK